MTGVVQRPDLVLLHGWALNGAVWAGLAGRLADRFRVTAIDLPGHGRSPAEPPAFARWAERLAETVPAGAILLGWSLGGQVAMALAARRPDLPSRLVLVCTTPRFSTAPGWPHGIPAAILAGFAERLGTDPRGTVERFLALQVHGDERARAALRQLRGTVQASPPAAPQALAAGLALLEGTDLRAELPRIVTPTLVVSGQRDRLCPPAAGRFLAAALPAARYVEIERAAHAPFLSHPQAFEAALREFAAAER